VAWVETESLSFTARHDSADEACAQRVLDDLEDLRLRLEDQFELVPDDVTVVVHASPGWLALAHPFLPAARWSAAPAGRRYLAGWSMAHELHVLSDPYMERRAAGEDSLRALYGTAGRLYAQIVVATNNPSLPPAWGPRRFARYLRWSWLVEGAAQFFAGQVPLFRAAVIRRLREGSRPAFPPSPRDAVILGGTVFDLLDRERGPAACRQMVARLHHHGPQGNIEAAFDARFKQVERDWRDHLRELSGVDLASRLIEEPDDERGSRRRRQHPRRQARRRADAG
jgi:hypothetical protein